MAETYITDETALDVWFDGFVANLRAHKMQLETLTASEDLVGLYNTLLAGDVDKIAHMAKIQAQKHFVARIVVDFLAMIKHKLPGKLAFDFNDSEVLAWAEIGDDDE